MSEEQEERQPDPRLSIRDSIALDFYRESVISIRVVDEIEIKGYAELAKEKADIICEVLGIK